jgi:hypothetical protein
MCGWFARSTFNGSSAMGIGTFARRHSLALSLIAIVAASAVVVSACEQLSGSAAPTGERSGSTQSSQ